MIAKVEADTGRVVVLRPEPGLHGKARGAYVASDPDRSRHLVVYDPAAMEFINHIVPHEIGHIRQYESAAIGERPVIRLGPEERAAAFPVLAAELPLLARRAIHDDSLPEVFEAWMTGLGSQLASFPADILIERALWDEHPPLRASQRAALEDSASAALGALQGQVALLTPRSVAIACNAMNYAFLREVGRFLQAPWMVRPYRGTVYESEGEVLLDLFRGRSPSDLSGCREVTDAWARRLGLAEWFHWGDASDTNDAIRRLWH